MTETTAEPLVDLFDADNHYYEPRDAYTRHIEPRYRDMYEHHLRDEVRHVQMDRILIDRFYARQSAGGRRFNARLFATMISRFFLRPTRSAMTVVDRLVVERPDLAPLRQKIVDQLEAVAQNPDYHAMMYSRASTPITFELFDRFDEMRRMTRVLRSYQPAGTEVLIDH